MGVLVNLTGPSENASTGLESLVIVQNISAIQGGRSLDLTGYPASQTAIRAGHLLIKEQSSGNYKPMPINAGATAYAALPAGHEYVGVLIADITTKKPFAAILTAGVVNQACMPFPFSPVASAVKTALPLIQFMQD